jgi:hypothetical protein
MDKIVPIVLVTGAVFGVAGIVLAASGRTVIGLAFLAVGIADAAIALVLRSRAGH